MKIDRKTLLTCTPEAAADDLYNLGNTLQGNNLKRSSWLLIANSLHVQRVSEILLRRLEAATTRQDALRVLRIARKWVHTRKGSKSARRQPAPENPMAVVAETSPVMYAQDEMEVAWEIEFEEEIGPPRGNFEEWLAEQASSGFPSRARHPGLGPTSILQDAIDRYAWDRRTIDRYQREDLRSRLDDNTYHRLLALANMKPGMDLTEAEITFLRDHHLDPILQYVSDPQQPLTSAPVRDGFSLAGVRIIEDHAGPIGHPFKVDWEAIEVWLAARLALRPQAESVSAVVASAYAFFKDAPAPTLKRFLSQAPAWQREWTSLLWYAYPRIPELLPDVKLSPAESPGWWEGSGAYVNDIRWERILDAGTGSHLVLHNLKMNVEDFFQQKIAIKNRYWNGTRKLLLAGGGTLRRMDYPAFTLVCRPSITLVWLETFSQLVILAGQLVALHNELSSLTRASLARWITDTYNSLSDDPLPEEMGLSISLALEHHAIAYLVLKEQVLRDAFQAAPFRLRHKHIQRFWADQAGGNSEAAADIPETWSALGKAFGSELLKEGLAHALLDHFKDDWGVTGDQAHQLKETLLILLRSVAIAYRLNAPWQPPYGGHLREEDLEHAQEVAGFIIQQTENAPLELAQALLIDPQQGLPRLAGGQVTVLERSCRRLVKETAGVSQEKISGAEARVFTCQPISKIRALDRGDLAGDCSSGSVPMRALSPHHNYYGIFENGEQQRGYMTVYEAWATEVSKKGEIITGERLPVLCLETINVPMRIFDAVQQDLLVMFEAVAKSRGLAEGLVLITGLGTWNYQNGEMLRQSRRFRQGQAVRLFPADPASWNVYRLLAPEAQHYTAFFGDTPGSRSSGSFRLLAPFQAGVDLIEPENLAETQRIAALPPKQLRMTARGEDGPAGFISELPEILQSS